MNRMTIPKKRTDMHEWPFEHLGTSPSRQDPSTSEEERCQQRGCRADECIRGKIHFGLLWRAYPGIRCVFKAKSKNDEVLPCIWDLKFVWYNWCMWSKRVGSMEIEESCMIRHFTEFDSFWLPNTVVSRC